MTQLRVLGILRDRRARMSELAAFLGLDKSTLSGLIDRAEKRGLLAREKSPGDRRVIEVFTTTAGLELAGTVYAEIRRELSPSMDRLDPQQRDQLTALMGVLLEHF
nr:MarR family transcriptional regulator [Kineosporia mesophila]